MLLAKMITDHQVCQGFTGIVKYVFFIGLEKYVVTAVEADKVLVEDKVIAMNLVWRHEIRGYKLEATVLSKDSGELMRLCGYVGKKNRSFVLLYRNDPIRKFTVHDRHKGPVSRTVHTEPHKHIWDCLLYTSPSPRDRQKSRMPSSA